MGVRVGEVGCGLSDLVDHYGGPVEALVVDRLEGSLEHGDHLLVSLGEGDEVEDLAVVSFFHPLLDLREVTGRAGLYVVCAAGLVGPQVVVEPIVCVTADDKRGLVLVAHRV